MISKLFSISIISVLMICSNQLIGQLKLAGRAGLNISNITRGEEEDEWSKPLCRYYLGITTKYELTEQIAISPELNLSIKGNRLKNNYSYSYGGAITEYNIDLKYINSYLELPVNLEYALFESFSLKGGPCVAFLLGAYQKGEKKSTQSYSTTYEIVNRADKSDLSPVDLGMSLSANYRFRSGVGVEGRYSRGFTSVSRMDDSMYNSVFSLGVLYFIRN